MHAYWMNGHSESPAKAVRSASFHSHTLGCHVWPVSLYCQLGQCKGTSSFAVSFHASVPSFGWGFQTQEQLQWFFCFYCCCFCFLFCFILFCLFVCFAYIWLANKAPVPWKWQTENLFCYFFCEIFFWYNHFGIMHIVSSIHFPVGWVQCLSPPLPSSPTSHPPDCKLHKGRNFVYFCLSLYSQHLKVKLAQN